MTAITLPSATEHALRELTGEERPDLALILVLRDAVACRLERIEAEVRALESKYGMDWAAFHQRWESEDRDEDYAWEAERDFLEWEGLVTRKQRLEDAFGWLP